MGNRPEVRRCVISYIVEPSVAVRFKLATKGKQSRKLEPLGFLGVFRLLRNSNLGISPRACKNDLLSPVNSLTLYRFASDIFILVAEIEAAGSLDFWKRLQNPNLTNFPKELFDNFDAKFKFLEIAAPHIYITESPKEFNGKPVIELKDKYVTHQLAVRITATDAVERALQTRINSLSFSTPGLAKVNSILHATAQWHEVWGAFGKNVPTLVSGYVQNHSKRVDFSKSKELLSAAINAEQRRVGWSSAAAVAVGNLVATTIPSDNWKWLAWPVSICIFTTIYVSRPFSRP